MKFKVYSGSVKVTVAFLKEKDDVRVYEATVKSKYGHEWHGLFTQTPRIFQEVLKAYEHLFPDDIPREFVAMFPLAHQALRTANDSEVMIREYGEDWVHREAVIDAGGDYVLSPHSTVQGPKRKCACRGCSTPVEAKLLAPNLCRRCARLHCSPLGNQPCRDPQN